MSTMISKLRRSSRAVAVAVATTAVLAGASGATAAAADRALPTTVTVRDTGWDFTAGPVGPSDRVVVPLSWGDTGWD